MTQRLTENTQSNTESETFAKPLIIVFLNEVKNLYEFKIKYLRILHPDSYLGFRRTNSVILQRSLILIATSSDQLNRSAKSDPFYWHEEPVKLVIIFFRFDIFYLCRLPYYQTLQTNTTTSVFLIRQTDCLKKYKLRLTYN